MSAGDADSGGRGRAGGARRGSAGTGGALPAAGGGLELLDDRYGRWSTVITSQLPTKTWHDYLGEPTVADAILDRLVHNAYKIA